MFSYKTFFIRSTYYGNAKMTELSTLQLENSTIVV